MYLRKAWGMFRKVSGVFFMHPYVKKKSTKAVLGRDMTKFVLE